MDQYEENTLCEKILDLLDPFRINKEYASMNLDKLKDELDRKTNCLYEVKNEDYFKIYQNEKVRASDNQKKSKSLIEEEIIQKGRLSASPSSYQSYTYKSRINTTPVFKIEDQQSPNTLNSYNADLTDEEALILAIKESEDIANEIVDGPFRDKKENVTVEKLNKITAESLKEEGKSLYCMLKNRPVNVSDELLDELYKMLVERDFNAAKKFLANKDLPLNVMQWIRQLEYEGNTLRQMLLTKPSYIHRCLRYYEN